MTLDAGAIDSVTSRLLDDVHALVQPRGRVGIGPSYGRRVGTRGHVAAQEYLVGRLDQLGLEPYGDTFALRYEADGERFANLIGVVPGVQRDLAPVLIAAHYDTWGDLPGADDNAAAVAIALEVARRTMQRPADRDVVIALFDAEEPPYFHAPTMGSTWFYERQANAPVHAALVMDLVGHALPIPGFEDVVFMTGMESDPGLEATYLDLADHHGVRVVPTLNRYVGDMSDHHVFRMNRVPYLFFSCGRWEHYHEPSDTPDRLDVGKMASIADMLQSVVHDVACRPLDGPWERHDTTPTELRAMQGVLGEVAGQFGLTLETRRDIDRLVGALLGRFGL